MAYTGYLVELVGGSSVLLPVTKQDFEFGNDVGTDGSAGSRHARIVTKRSSKPKMSFTTENVRVALTGIGTEGTVIKSGGTYTACNIYQVSLDINGLPAGSGHRKISITRGAIFPKMLSAKAGGNAELTVEVHAISVDGITSPVTIGSGTLPAWPGVQEEYAIGPMTIESISIDELTSIGLDFGIKPEAILQDSAIAPSQLQVEKVLPKLDFEGHNAAVMDDFNVDGLEVTHANTVFFLRQRNITSEAYFGDGESKHMKFTVDGYGHIDSPHSSDGNKIATVKGAVELKHDGTNSPIVYTANQAIS